MISSISSSRSNSCRSAVIVVLMSFLVGMNFFDSSRMVTFYVTSCCSSKRHLENGEYHSSGCFVWLFPHHMTIIAISLNTAHTC